MGETRDLLWEVQASDPSDLSLTGLMFLPPASRDLLLWLIRRGQVRAAEVAAFTGLPGARAVALTRLLVQRGVLELAAGGDTLYRVRLQRARPERRGQVPGLDLP